MIHLSRSRQRVECLMPAKILIVEDDAVTQDLMVRLVSARGHAVEAVTDGAKDFYRRPRPYFVDTSLANGKLEHSFSYPSGHSTESMVLALVLADLFPDRHDAIVAEARSIGWHRVEIARHYPTDIYAGRVLAQAIVREMKQNPGFQKDFAAAQAEIAAAQK